MQTKQEEIREGIARRMFESEMNRDQVFGADTRRKAWRREKAEYLARAYNDLHWLHSQGVLIKARCPDCAWGQFGEEHVGMTPCHSCNSTGYIYESLIKEE